jgi:Tol biopolymer transport system component
MKLKFAFLIALAGCSNRKDVQCDVDSNCDLATGGVCVTASTGNNWCAYPDQNCAGGFRFSDYEVGDGVGGMCADARVDAGVDAGACTELIAFTREDGLYVVRPDGTGLQSLATGNREAKPVWSPDGSRVAFERGDPSVNLDIWAVNRDGTGLSNLTQGITQHDSNPVWSPDGSRISFASQRTAAPQYDLWVMNSDGSNPTMVDEKAVSSTWSPDGTKIAYASYKVGSKFQIYVANADGSNSTNISNSTYADSDPQWSPDGTLFIFSGIRPSIPQTYVMNADGSNQQALAPSVQSNAAPRWSRDSKRVALFGSDTNSADVFVINADRTNLVNVTPGTLTSDEDAPTWSPDGKHLAVRTADQGGNGKADISRINDDGTGPLHLTMTNLYDEKDPAWSACR